MHIINCFLQLAELALYQARPMFYSHDIHSTEKLFREGMTAYQHGDARNAVEKLSKAIYHENNKTNPDHYLLSDIYNIRGEAYLSASVAMRSHADFMHALVYHPGNENALNNLGVWYFLGHAGSPDYRKSLEYLDRALRLNPERKDITLNRAIVRIKSGNEMGFEDLKKLELEEYPDASIALMEYGE
jgi:Tfp pilus assembly protein PilF